MLLGSVSNYLVQKSSSPVMVSSNYFDSLYQLCNDCRLIQVTRRPLRLSRTVHRRTIQSLDRTARVASLADAAIEKESHAQAVDKPEEHAEGEGTENNPVKVEERDRNGDESD